MDPTPETSDAHASAAELIPWLVNGTLAGDEAVRLRAHLAVCPACRSDLEAERRLYESVRSGGPLVFAGEPSLEKLMARIEADDYAAPRAPIAESDQAGPLDRDAAGADGSNAQRGMRLASAHGRVAARDRTARRGVSRPRLRSARLARWLAAAVVIEALTLGLGAWMWHARGTGDTGVTPRLAALTGDAAAPYRTLSTPEPRYGSGARVRVVFRSNLTLSELQQLLQRVNAHIVDGPTEARVYTLGFAAPAPSSAEIEARLAALRADPHVLFAEPAGERPP